MNEISLYPTKTTPRLPDNVMQVHWEEAAIEAEKRLARFLGVPSHLSVLLVDRATHALELVYRALSPPCSTVLLPINTYRAAEDAAQRAMMFTEYAELGEGTEGICLDYEVDNNTITVPTTLGGVEPDLGFMAWRRIVYDCAHTCYRDMFRNAPSDWHELSAAVLSFYPTKPCGAFGGGLVVARPELTKLIRSWSEPAKKERECSFYYPQTAQSFGIMWALEQYDSRYWMEQVVFMVQVSELVRALVPTAEQIIPHPKTEVLTPHLLSFSGLEHHEKKLNQLGLETGHHYPNLSGEGPLYTSIPFHTPEVLERLEEL